MKRFFTSLFASIALFVASSGMVLVAQPVGQVAALDANQQAVCDSIGAGDGCNDNTGTSVGSVIRTVVTVLSIFVGVLAVIMIIVSGLKYITAAGDSSKITSAKNTLVYALVGLVVAALAQFIVKFVLEKV